MTQGPLRQVRDDLVGALLVARMSKPTTIKYVVVTPVRDEEAYVDHTIRSMLAQTILPTEWIIVDDGSQDGTAEILQRYACDHDWIRVVTRRDRGYRAAGSGVMEAFYAGFEQLETSDWDLMVKFDGDLEFTKDYFERCIMEFLEDETLGVGGGVIYNRIAGRLELERHPLFHVRGATKIYRRECWSSIGGLIRLPGWDTLDEVHANMNGWTTRSFPDLGVVQLRMTGAAAGQWSNWVKNGRANYVVGYHPVYLLAKAVARIFRSPYLIASAGVLFGFFEAVWSGVPQIENRELITYLRRQQLRRLFGMKSIWR